METLKVEGVDATVYFKDSANMSELVDNSVALTVTSPPYFWMRGIVQWDSYAAYLSKMFRIFKEVYRVTEPNRYFIINISDYIHEGKKYSIPFDFVWISKRAGWRYRDDVIWVKHYGTGASGSSGGGKRAGSVIQNPYPMRWYPNNQYEHWLIFRKPCNEEKSYPKEDKIDIRKMRPFLSDVWSVGAVTKHPTQDDELWHPASFPKVFPSTFIRYYTFTGEKVLDPFLGSGTTVLAAIELGRVGIGYEIDLQYKRVIEEKLHALNYRITQFIEKNKQ